MQVTRSELFRRYGLKERSPKVPSTFTPYGDVVLLLSLAHGARAKRIFEFGTSRGETSASLYLDDPTREIITLDIHQGIVSRSTTEHQEREVLAQSDVGRAFKDPELPITQIFADSIDFDAAALGSECFDLIFIDGAHDLAHVAVDTLSALTLVRPGGWILWHDAQHEDTRLEVKPVVDRLEAMHPDILRIEGSLLAAWEVTKKARNDKKTRAALQEMSALRPASSVVMQGPRLTGVVLARNEERRIEECLRNLRPHVEELILLDMESTDATARIAAGIADKIVRIPLVPNFDGSRNAAINVATGDWLLFLDADEMITPELGSYIRNLISQSGSEFEGAVPCFRSFFMDKWIEGCGWFPGYTSARLLKRGHFHWNEAIHGGVQVDGRTILLPNEPLNLTIAHYSYDDISHYIEKFNRYTSRESEKLDAALTRYSWRTMAREFGRELGALYDDRAGFRDGQHGLILSILGAFYRLTSHAKVYERHLFEGSLMPDEARPPANAEEFLAEAMSGLIHRAKVTTTRTSVPVLWEGPLLDASGYAAEGREFVFGLEEAGIELAASSINWSHVRPGLEEMEHERLTALCERTGAGGDLRIVHFPPWNLERDGRYKVNVCRTTFETDRIPEIWVPRLAAMDEVWVPTEFNKETFASSGVPIEKLKVVPQAINSFEFREGGQALRVPGAKGYQFLSIFDWTMRKGWDALLQAYAEEFWGDESVSLILRVNSPTLNIGEIEAQKERFLTERFGLSRLGMPRVILLHQPLRRRELLALYRGVDAFVLPTRGEGWGRPLMEAMASVLPTIATNWSGQKAFMNEGNSYLVDCEVVPVSEEAAKEQPVFTGHQWAEPDIHSLRGSMRRVKDNLEEAAAIGRRGREELFEKFDRSVVAEDMAEHVRRLIGWTPTVRSARAKKETKVLWHGAFLNHHSLAHVNRELALKFSAGNYIRLSLDPTEPSDFKTQDGKFASLLPSFHRSLSPDITVCHHYPPCLTPPASGKWIVMQPWEFSSIPKSWVEAFIAADEIWVNSEFTKRSFISSGLDEKRVKVIPLGIDPEIFNPNGTKMDLATKKTLKFCYVGGLIHRKGFDVLLEAYRQAFTAEDDVCLVVKGIGSTSYYPLNFRSQIAHVQRSTSPPEILLIENFLTEKELASLYRACDVLVSPYRGEGFGLPVLEAMACGLPVIVTKGGSTDDFVPDGAGFKISARPSPISGGSQPWGDFAGPALELEPALHELVAALLRCRDQKEELAAMGDVAASSAAGMTWDASAEKFEKRLRALQTAKSVPKRAVVRMIAPARQESEPSSEVIDPKLVEEAGISLCMIVKNEERVLADALRSAKPFFKEIIVVDTGSTDLTKEIATEFGARLYDFPWTDSFSDARNESLRHATGEWIFWMDADDTLPPESGRILIDAVLKAPESVMAFVVPVQFVEIAQAAGATRVDHVKLFRNLPDLTFEGRIHEQIAPAIYEHRGELIRLPAVVLHTGYDTSPEGQAKKRERDVKLLDLDLEEQPKHPFRLFNKGMTLHHTGYHAAAIGWLRKCIKYSHPKASHVRKTYAMLGVSERSVGKKVDCLKTFEKGLRVAPGDAELHFQMGITLQDLGRYAEAREHFFQVLSANIEDHFSSVDLSILSFKTYHNIGTACLSLGDYAGAREWWLRAAQLTPPFIPSVEMLFFAAVDHRDLECAYFALSTARAADAPPSRIAEMETVFAECRSVLEDALSRTSEGIPPISEQGLRMRRVRALLAKGWEEEATPELEALAKEGVAEAAFFLGVQAIKAGHLGVALVRMERALELNPDHEPTREQVANLRKAIDEDRHAS